MIELEPYLVELEKDGFIKRNNCLDDCVVGDNICQLVIVITHNEYIFFANNGIYRVWTYVGDKFL